MPTILPEPMVRAVCIDADGADQYLVDGAEYLIPESRPAHSLVAVYRTDGTRLGGNRVPHLWFRTRFREVGPPAPMAPAAGEIGKREANLKRRAIECPKVNLP